MYLVPVYVAAPEVSAQPGLLLLPRPGPQGGEGEAVPAVQHPHVVKHAAVPGLHPGGDHGQSFTHRIKKKSRPDELVRCINLHIELGPKENQIYLQGVHKKVYFSFFDILLFC